MKIISERYDLVMKPSRSGVKLSAPSFSNRFWYGMNTHKITFLALQLGFRLVTSRFL